VFPWLVQAEVGKERENFRAATRNYAQSWRVRVVKNITSALRKVECDSPSIAYSVLPGGVTAKGETAELFAGETCGVSEADRDLVEISKADRLISFDDPLIVGLSDFA